MKKHVSHDVCIIMVVYVCSCIVATYSLWHFPYHVELTILGVIISKRARVLVSSGAFPYKLGVYEFEVWVISS